MMKGEYEGVASLNKTKSGCCLYCHEYGNFHDLACGDAIINVPVLKETFGIAKELIQFIRKSPKMISHLKVLRNET